MPADITPHAPIDRRGIDIDDAVALYEAIYTSDNIHIDRAAPDFEYRYRAVGDQDVALATSAVRARRWGTIDPGTEYILAWATGPGITLDTASSDPIQMRAGVPMMYPTGRAFEFEALPTTQHLLRFGGEFLEGVESARTGDAPTRLQFTGSPEPEALAILRGAISESAGALLDPLTPLPVRRRANLRVAEAVIEAFRPIPVVDQRRGGSQTTRRAQEWMVAHASEPITISDVAAATGTGARTLQAAFQRHVGMSPMEFLRTVRLHRVRAELLRPERSWNVSDRAIAWGFTHMGRFSAYYASQFGELPSATLAQGRAIRSASLASA
ncbi:helix-turn-helix domain-containing protein [Curtobacterium ammoniigenes]|uniref:helix-turn-helix domain-containing protein n=1 Tax=Curtobacterium ammoniigenes TaxID=395387 RepID=UPI00082D0587|nr:helix-turn-helix domain-containing protein [Curtobacterium ammoniigenes]